MKKIRLAVLGSTGSIGISTLDVVKAHPDHFEVVALSAHSRWDVLLEQAQSCGARRLAVTTETAYAALKQAAPAGMDLLFGTEGLKTIASDPEVDFVMAGMVGAAGLEPFIAALESGRRIGLANKEVLVMAGEYFHAQYGEGFLEQVLPVDSEHSAIYQCLQCGRRNEIESIILTASGGPFREHEDLQNLSVEQALKHPNWDMGPKISIDSATLMNKGLEMIEAYWLFPVKSDQIQILIHPQSIIHSMVAFRDGSILAHLGVTDMRIPIQYAMSAPHRLESNLERLDFTTLKQLTFAAPDLEKFQCLALATDALRQGNIYPAVLNAANEVSVAAFLKNQISLLDIARCNRHVLEQFPREAQLNLQTILAADKKAREKATQWISSHSLPV